MAKTSETVRPMTDGQRSDIIATMVSAMPSLSFEEAQAVIGSKGPFVADIGKVFAKHAKPAPDAQPTTEFTIGNPADAGQVRTYELVPFLNEGESSVRGNTMVERAQEIGANLGEEDGQFIMEHQNQIPEEFRGKFLVFMAWHHPSGPQDVAYLGWFGGRWCRDWGWLGGVWDVSARLVRRRPATNPPK